MELLLTNKHIIYEQHSISILAHSNSQRCGIGNGMVLLLHHDEGG